MIIIKVQYLFANSRVVFSILHETYNWFDFRHIDYNEKMLLYNVTCNYCISFYHREYFRKKEMMYLWKFSRKMQCIYIYIFIGNNSMDIKYIYTGCLY